MARSEAASDRFNLARWWSKKYSRPRNDPLFVEKPEAFWLQEMFEDVYEEKFSLERQLQDDALKFDEKRTLSQKLRGIYKALGEYDQTMGEDPLIDKWEAELAAGITPDLDEAP